jgi:hypothetical protein
MGEYPDLKPGAAAGAAKEPHEMTKEEWLDAKSGRLASGLLAGDKGKSADEMGYHRDHVKAAIAAGKPVPQDVLADYPDLAAKAAPAGQPAAPAPPRTHNVHLPKDKKRLTIDQASAALKQMGYGETGRTKNEPHEGIWTGSSELIGPDGKTFWASDKAVRDLVYGGQAKDTNRDDLAEVRRGVEQASKDLDAYAASMAAKKAELDRLLSGQSAPAPDLKSLAGEFLKARGGAKSVSPAVDKGESGGHNPVSGQQGTAQEKAMNEMVRVTGDTYKHKDAIKAAGGKFDAASKTWTAPAGAADRLRSLPGLDVASDGERAGKAAAEEARQRTPGEQVVRSDRVYTLQKSTGMIPVEQAGGKKGALRVEHVVETYGLPPERSGAWTHSVVVTKHPEGSEPTFSVFKVKDEAEAQQKYDELAAKIPQK